ncbi:MAG TPA: hypothetical protein VLN57_12505 [Xanthobacteraceae bacterium]|nr:hypothetical protein [Xanthobacteraceae bacterium]
MRWGWERELRVGLRAWVLMAKFPSCVAMSLNLPTLTDRYFRRQRLPHAKRRSALYCALGAALWLATVNASKAHDVDCDRLIKTNAPFELRTLGSAIAKNGNEARSSQIFQIYRSDSGLTTTYSKFVSGNSMFEGKRISYGPFVIELTARTIKTIKTTYEYHGIDVATVPLDTNYEYEGVMKSDNGKVQAFRTSYTYIGKEAALVGGCRLEVIKYNSKSSTADGSGTALSEVEYSSQLQQAISTKVTTIPSQTVAVTVAKELSLQFNPFGKD